MNAIHLNSKGHGSQPISSVNTDPAVTPKRYSATAIALHWVLGLVIVALFGVGLYMANLPFSPLRLKLYNWHKWTGVTLLALTVFRLVWRLTHRPPALPRQIADAMPTWQHHVHHATHAYRAVHPVLRCSPARMGLQLSRRIPHRPVRGATSA